MRTAVKRNLMLELWNLHTVPAALQRYENCCKEELDARNMDAASFLTNAAKAVKFACNSHLIHLKLLFTECCGIFSAERKIMFYGMSLLPFPLSCQDSKIFNNKVWCISIQWSVARGGRRHLASFYIPYVLESNPHPFYSYRGLKGQMRIRIECRLDSRSRAGVWPTDRASVRAVRTIQGGKNEVRIRFENIRYMYY
jgi:hypothetical protein